MPLNFSDLVKEASLLWSRDKIRGGTWAAIMLFCTWICNVVVHNQYL